MALSTRGHGDDVQKNMRELTSAKNIKDDVMLLMAPYINFEQFLVPAPTSICILGQLMLVATQTDFDLSKKPPKGGFQFLRHPTSFRACLVQVANDGYRAFNKAHSNMDKIRLQTLETPNILKSALTVLFKGSPDEIEDFLPIELNSMKNSTDDCLKYAQETEKAFEQVMSVTGELLESCVSTQGQYEQELRDTDIRLKIAEEAKAKLELEEKHNEDVRKKIEKSMDDAEKAYYKSLEEIPTGWGLVTMQASENISNTVSGVLNCVTLGVGSKLLAGEKALVKGATILSQNMKGIGDVAGKVTGAFKGGDTSSKRHNERSVEEKNEPFTHVMDSDSLAACMAAMKVQQKESVVGYSKSTFHGNCTLITLQFPLGSIYCTSQSQFLNTTFVKDKSLNTSGLTKDVKQQLQQFKGELKHIKAEETKGKTEIAKKVKQLCGGFITLCDDLEEVVDSVKTDEKTRNDIAERLIEYHADTIATATKASTIMGTGHLDVSPPVKVQQVKTGGEEERSAKDLASDNAKLKLHQSMETFKHTQEMYDKACERLQDTSKELRRFMAETAELDMKKVDFEKIKKILKEGIARFAELRKQWSQIIQFFQMTSNIIDVCLNKSVKKLTEKVEAVANRSLNGYTIGGLRKDMIYQQAFQAAKISHVVNMVSTSYVQVSQNHIMDRIAGLSKLISYNPETDEKEMKEAMSALTHDFEQAQDEIVELVRKNKRDFDQKVEQRLKALARALPPSSPADDQVQAAVKKGMSQGIAARKEAEALADASLVEAGAAVDVDDVV